jgi:class 3 adenylate cyclase/tetratricopeptide (TPR) repeat protein
MSSAPVTLLFTDLVNSTELLQRAGDEQAQRIFQAHHRLLKRCVAAHGGEEVKWLGDGLMTVFASPADALRAAVAMQQAARRRAAGERLAIRVGLHVGEALREESDYFGTAVVIARRLCDHGQAGQILCSTLVSGLLAGHQAFSFRDCGPLALKGVTAPVAACEVLYQQDQPTALLTHTPFVGRAAELTRLAAKVREARAGSGGFVMLVGEPGIGKTRTLEECAETARAEGALVLWGRCYEGEAARPYGPFVEALGDYARGAAPEVLRADLGFGAAPLARLVPALRDRLPDIPEPAPMQPDEERVRLLDAVAQFVIGLAARAPVVLVLDDLHWADAASVAVVRHVARFAPRHRLLLLGAYRDVEVTLQQPLTDTLGALPRETTYEHLALPGLDGTEVGQLLEAVADQEVPASLVTAITAETSGNPFFIREVLLHLIEEGRIVRCGGEWISSLPIEQVGIPQGVRQVIQRRLARLSEAANRLLRAAAGFSGSVRFDLVSRVASLDEEDALDAIDEALGAQLLRPASDAEHIDFTHALVRHTLYAELSQPRRVRLHRRIAEAMEQVYGNRAGEHADEIARHYHQSVSLPGAERGVSHALVAAASAEGSAAFAEASEYLRMALALSSPSEPRRPRMLARLALALTWSLALEQAEQTATQAAASIAVAEGNDAAAEFVADATDAMWAASTSRAWSLATQGLKYIGARRDTTWARLMVHDIERREAADPEYPGIPVISAERQEVTTRLWELPAFRHFGQRTFAYMGFRSRADALARAGDDPIALVFWAGEYRKVLPLLEHATATVLERGQVALAIYYLTMIARLQNARGDLASSMSTYGRLLELSKRINDPPWLQPFVLAVQVSHFIVTGEGWEFVLTAVDSRVREGTAENQWGMVSMRSMAAYGSAHVGRTNDALRWLASTLPAIDRAPGSAVNYPALLSMAITTLEELGRTDHIDLLERNLRTKWLEPDFRYLLTDSRFSLAMLCSLRGKFEEAVELFAKARAIFEEQGSAPMRARTDFYEARMYFRRNGPDDRDRAATLLRAALEQFGPLGMTGWARRAEDMLAVVTERAPARDVEGETSSAIDGERPRQVADQSTFRRQGPVWTITFRGQTFGLPHVRGLADLQQLILHPGRELHSTRSSHSIPHRRRSRVRPARARPTGAATWG